MRKKAIRQRIALTMNDLLHRPDGVEHIVVAVDAAGIKRTHSWRSRTKARQFKSLLKESDITYTEIKIIRREWMDDFVYSEPKEVS